MNNKILALILAFLLQSCAHQGAYQSTTTEKSPKIESKKTTRARQLPKYKAVFHVIAPDEVELILFHLGKKIEERLSVEDSISQIELISGYWRVNGFIINGNRYNILSSPRHYVFRIRNNKDTYAGSFIFQCPQVGQDYIDEMKKMLFFNRYPFSSRKRLCEMLVGNDHASVNRLWVDAGSGQEKPLTLGF